MDDLHPQYEWRRGTAGRVHRHELGLAGIAAVGRREVVGGMGIDRGDAEKGKGLIETIFVLLM